MLIEFSVANFRSIRERQTLSMVAAPRIQKRNNVCPAPLKEKFPPLLKAAVIYGPNASGKSNLLKAMQVIPLIARRTPDVNAASLPVAGFAFDQMLKSAPSELEVHFIVEQMRYQFILHVSQERVSHEELRYFPNGQETLLYSRTHIEDRDEYHFDGLSASSDLLATWQKITPPKVLFITQAVANSDESLVQLRLPFSWLMDGMFCMLNGMESMTRIAQDLVSEDDAIHAQELAFFLNDVDIPISKISVETVSRTLPVSEGENKSATSRVTKQQRMLLTHTTQLGDADISFADESEGTKNLIGFWVPWSIRNLRRFVQRVLVVDELDSSLHPLIVAALVRKHLESTIPTQLIFSTHDTHLMDAKLLRRDQIWITDRDINGATQLRCVHEFQGREGEDVEKRYYDNRYRGLPALRDLN